MFAERLNEPAQAPSRGTQTETHRWIPWLSGRRVPILLAVVPGSWAAVILTVAGKTFAYDLLTTGGGAHPTWEIVVVTISWTTWGNALGLAVLAYRIRRRGRCRHCGRG